MDERETHKQKIARCLTVLRRMPEGEELYQTLMDYCGINRGPFSPESAEQTAYNCGKHSVAIYLKSMDDKTNPRT